MTIKMADLPTVIVNLEEQISRATNQFNDWVFSGEDYEDPTWIIETCFLQLLTVLEVLNLPELRNLVCAEYRELKAQGGFTEEKPDPDGDSYSPVIGRLHRYVIVLKGLLPSDKYTTVTKDLLDIIRNIHYVITDKDVFSHAPSNEQDVHIRIEAVLKCVFPDLKRKPSLSKQIKNFEPDTGIPSLRTLVEYKFLSRKEHIGVIADQLLADTRGYASKDWERFLYVIYETNRFRTEADWNQLMREADVPSNTTVVVLSGEPHTGVRSDGKKRKPNKTMEPTR